MFTNVTILFLEPNNEYSKNEIIVKSNKVVVGLDMLQKHWKKSCFLWWKNGNYTKLQQR